ncbi:hypothetical protein IJ00_14740 [Calothrix sp. 336/3]|nr:hypothetical protein IJ00_14740 [Calothrix sp. 336/3]
MEQLKPENMSLARGIFSLTRLFVIKLNFFLEKFALMAKLRFFCWLTFPSQSVLLNITDLANL